MVRIFGALALLGNWLANGANYVRINPHSAVIHLEAISSLVLPN